MNRKLHNTLSALTASGALLVVSLIAAAPVASDLNPARVLVDAIGNAAVQTIDTGSTESPRSTGTSSHNRRQTLVMPYFSFLPRG